MAFTVLQDFNGFGANSASPPAGLVDITGSRFSVSGGNLVQAVDVNLLNFCRNTSTRLDQISEVTLVSFNGGFPGCSVRLSDTSATNGYVANIDPGAGGVVIQKKVGGTYTVIAANTGMAITSGKSYRIRLQAVGSNPTALLATLTNVTDGGSITTSVNDSTSGIQAAGFYGINNYLDTNTASYSRFTTYEEVADLNTFAVNNANIISAPYTSEFNGSSWVQSNTTGWYQRLKLTGATYLRATFDVSALVAQGATAGQYPFVRAIVNDKLTYDAQLTSASGLTTLALSLTGSPEALIYFHKAGDSNADRWSVSGRNSVRIADYRSDGTLTTLTAQTKRLLLYGDSMLEGAGAASANSTAGALLAAALKAEYGQVGFGSQGWGNAGSGSVPTFNNAWNLQRAGVSRSFATQPDYVVIMQGTNDGTFGVSDGTVTTNATATLQAMRTAMPAAWIFVVVPFGQYKKTAIQSAVTTVSDPKIVLIDLGVEAARGINTSGLGVTFYSDDSLHPNAYNHARLGSMLTAAIQDKLSAVGAKRRQLKI